MVLHFRYIFLLIYQAIIAKLVRYSLEPMSISDLEPS